MGKLKQDELLKSIGRSFASMIEQHGYKPPLRLAVIAENGSGMIIDELAATQEGMKAKYILVAGAKKGFDTPIKILFFDSAGKSGSSVIGSESDVKKTGADLAWEI